MAFEENFRRLKDFIGGLGPSAVAFSGGVDSSVVAAAAFTALGKGSLAVTVVSELCPEAEADETAGVARAIGIRHVTLRVTLLHKDSVASNPKDRCYHCKKEVFHAVREAARKEGISALLDGTNADDSTLYRPGLKALREMGVISPLAALGFTKSDVREMAKGLRLPNCDRPSSPCLATRFPYGTRLTGEAIRRVGEAEEFIRSLGFRELRVRDHDGLARIEVEPGSLPALVSGDLRKKIVAKLKSLGYNYVSLDMEGYRSGSMDVNLKGRE